MTEPQYVAHVISHTHWDREWYRTFEVFRMRLVDAVDALLDLFDRDPAYGPFYLDGQMCPVDDYIAVRPENAERLRGAFASGRLYSGPWYVQPDEFLVSGEALIRNLFVGRRACEAWGTGAAIGYAPDAFGHTGQMPQILRGFGIDNAVLFRGITADQVPSEFEWRSPDGSSVLCLKMPDNNAYSNWLYRFRQTLADTDRGVPIDPERVVEEGSALLDDSIAERPMTRYLLWMDGVDHIFPQPRTPEIMRILNQRMGDRVRVLPATLREHVDAVLSETPDLPVVTGELRVANRTWKLQALLAHVASSRIHLKQRNHRCETLLERWAEPFSAIVWALARTYGPPDQTGRLPEQAASSPSPMLRHAWKTLLLNQAHDSICGCSIDQVHRDMEHRYDEVEQVGEALATRSLQSLATWIRTAPESSPPEAHPSPEDSHNGPVTAIAVFNPLAWPRSGEMVETVVHFPIGLACESVAILDGDREIPCTVEAMSNCHTLTQAPHDIPVGSAWRRFRVRFLADAPAFGYRTYHVAPRDSAPSDEGLAAIEVGDNWVSNGLIRVEAYENGTLTLRDLRTGRVYEGLGTLEDGGDFGDGYNYVPPAQDTVLRSSEPLPRGSECNIKIASTPLGGRLTLNQSWYVPAARDGDHRDATAQAPIYVTIRAKVVPGSPRLDLNVVVYNQACDHRLRILFPSGARNAREYAVEQAFDVVHRPIARPDCTGWKEPQPATGPQKSWMDVSDGAQGLCVINVGLPECEVFDDTDRTAAVTLLRCTGNGVGLPEDQEEGQMRSVYRFTLSLLPHTGSWHEDRVWHEAHSVNTALGAAQTDLHDGPMAPAGSFVEVASDDLVITALKMAEDDSGIVVRGVNLGEATIQPDVAVHAPCLGNPSRVRLDEEPLEGTPSVRPREIVTLKFHATQE